MEICHYLRWKSRREDMDGDELALAVLHNHVPYTCLQTCQPWGLDGDVAAPETCTSDRPCWTGRKVELSAELSAALRDGDDDDDE